MLSQEVLLGEEIPEGSTVIQERVLEARARQARRFSDKVFRTNHSLRPKELKVHCKLDSRGQRLVAMAIRQGTAPETPGQPGQAAIRSGKPGVSSAVNSA